MEGKKPGEMVSVETNGEKATSITVSDMSAMGQPDKIRRTLLPANSHVRPFV